MTRADLHGRIMGGRYRLDTAIAAGGMGEVWHATDLQLNRAVALKFVLPAMRARPDAVARFEREARTGAALAHPNIVHTLDFGIDAEMHYLVLELVSGGNLLDYQARNSAIALSTAILLAYQLADALSAAHKIGLVHRDLKPENVVVEIDDGNLRVKITDFGMAFLMDAEDPKAGRLTLDGTSGGTPEYMAPEQTAGVVGPASDVYALGCLMFELLVGRAPFVGSVGKVFAAHLYAPVPRLSEYRGDVVPGLEDLVARMLAKHPSDRPTAENVRRRLGLLGSEWLDPASRARDGQVASDRATRMMPTTPPPLARSAATAEIELIGTLDLEAQTALAAAGIEIALRGGAAIIILGADLAAVALACTRGLPVVADAARNDFRRISDLLRLGVADVVLSPVVASNLVHKLVRVLEGRKDS